MGKLSEKKRASNKRWDDANVDRMSMVLPKGYREKLKARADALGLPVNRYLRSLIDADLGISGQEETGKAIQTAHGCQDTPLPLGTTHGEN